MSVKHSDLTDSDWPYVLTLLPQDYEETARKLGAFQRRRGVDSPATLLRLALQYAADLSGLRTVAARARVQGLAQLSDVALRNRLRGAAPWLGRLLTDLLRRTVARPHAVSQPWRLRLQDATTVSRPGSKGTDWRVHLGFDLQTLTMDQVEVTDAKGGETLTRAEIAPGEIWGADRGYAHRAGIAHCVAAGGHLIVRLNWQNVPLLTPEGAPFDLLAALRALPDAGYGDFPVQVAPDPERGLPALPGRVVAVRKSPAQAEAARRKVRQTARKKGKTPDARTLETAGYVFLFTTLPQAWLSAREVLDLYRFRWQVELAFKRMKSLLGLDEMSAKDPALCRAFLFGKLLLYALTERLCRPSEAAFSPWSTPWGYGPPLPAATDAGVAAHAGGVRHGLPRRCARPDLEPVGGRAGNSDPQLARGIATPQAASGPRAHPRFAAIQSGACGLS